MAKVLGESGRYVTEQSIKKYQKQFLVIFLVFWALTFVDGYLYGVRNIPLALILTGFFSASALLSLKWTNKQIKALEIERINFRKGAVGEAVVGYVLESFPDDYQVINDLSTPFGNIDHVVVGPTGIYVLDTKNWRGIITAADNGEILVNGKPTDKPAVKILTGRLMSIKEKIKVLCGADSYVQGILVFPSAHVDAKWGTTGYVHCMTDDTLYKYIVENKKNNKLSKKEIDSISHAFLALARMDTGFEDKK
ncbi:MAG: NERD domain-containing protein [Nitrospirae bacterium]|nr:MAG: NERD domain-containing protein [Nitrospirota bacterium]